MRLLLKGGRVIDPAQNYDARSDVLVGNGRIVRVAPDIAAGDAQVVDVSGKVVVPGLIDMHVHLREPGLEAKEDIATGTRAAAMGGFTAVACMPNTRPVIDNAAGIAFILARAAQTGAVKVYPVGSVTKGSEGRELAEIGDMRQAGAVAVSDDGNPIANAGVMRRALEYAWMFAMPVIAHCEDRDLVGDGVMHEGFMSTVLGLKGIPALAEEVMVARDIRLAAYTGAHVHIAHISTAGSVALVREAKQRGINVTAEVTPHHFTLTDAALRGYDPNTKVNPPLRTDADVAAVKEALRDGTIDCIATDHAPHAFEEKDVEFNYAPFGISGLETAVSLVLDQLVRPGILNLPEAIAKLTVNPAQILGLQAGTLREGATADITVLDLDAVWVVDTSRFQSKGKNSPFHRRRLTGKPYLTMVEGKIVMHEGRLWR